MRRCFWIPLATVAALFSSVSLRAGADAVISTGVVSVGVSTHGFLGANGVGVSLNGVGDAFLGNAGCVCEGWGVKAVETTFIGDLTGVGFARALVPPNPPSLFNLSSGQTVDPGTGAIKSVSDMLNLDIPGGLTGIPAFLQVTQVYQRTVTPFLIENRVTIKNTSANHTYHDLQYRRVADFDVSPQPFLDYITIQGLPAGRVLHSSDNGFANANPLSPLGAQDPGTLDQNVRNSGPLDHGAAFDLGLNGPLAPGAEWSFSLFYGAAYNEIDAINALAAVNGEVYFLAKRGTPEGRDFGRPGTFILGLQGVGGTPVAAVVPEPGVLGLTAGLAGLAIPLALRRRRR